MKARILIVDDERNLRVTLAEILASHGYEILEAENSVDALAMLRDQNPDLVFCDWKMPDGGGEELLQALQRQEEIRKPPVIIMTAYGTSGNAIKAIQLGAYDFISKPFDLDEICTTAKRALQHIGLQDEVEELRQKLLKSPRKEQGEIVGSSRTMLGVFKDIGRVAASDTTVLIRGESGTGKSSLPERFIRIVRAPMDRSSRSTAPLFLTTSWSRSFSVMSAVLSPVQSHGRRGSSKLPIRVRSFWMKSANYPSACNLNSYGSCRNKPSREWVAMTRFTPTFVPSPLPTGTSAN